MPSSRLLPFLARHAAALLAIALTRLLLLPVEPYLRVQIIALLYLLPVMVSTVLWSLTPGVLAAFAAFLVFNYYYIQPYYTFDVHETQDLITLIIFLVVAVVMSQLIGQAREGVRLARSREWEATRMYELISALAGLPNRESIARALAYHTRETFAFTRVEVTVAGSSAGSGGSAGSAVNGGEEPLILADPPGAPAPGQPARALPLHTARGREGEIRLWAGGEQLSAQEMRLLEAFTSQAALALERVRLARGEHKARVLEESDQLKSSLLNSVSHELRSPLAAIKASVSSLRSGAVNWNSAARQELLATIEEETDHLNLLVGNLLDMSRIESGALRPNRRWNAIDEIAMGVATKMRSQLDQHQIEMDFAERLPLVATDYIMIEQVFTNLISNGVKYSPPGSVIAISARQEGEWLRVTVTNQGPPVPPEHLERIFDKFYRVTAADRVTGTGLGLSICKGIIEAHGGKIWAENQPGGFSFHFRLPLALDGSFPMVPKVDGDG